MSEHVSVHRIRILLRDMPVELLRRELAAVFPQPSRAEAYAVIAGFEARRHRKLTSPSRPPRPSPAAESDRNKIT